MRGPYWKAIHFKAKLAAKASTASQQITAQLKSDENKLRGHIAEANYYLELKAAIAQYKAARQPSEQ